MSSQNHPPSQDSLMKAWSKNFSSWWIWWEKCMRMKGRALNFKSSWIPWGKRSSCFLANCRKWKANFILQTWIWSPFWTNLFLILSIQMILKPLAQVREKSEVVCRCIYSVEVLGATKAQRCESCIGLQVPIGGEPVVNPEGFESSESIFTVYFTCRGLYSVVQSFWAFNQNKDMPI